MLQYEHDSDKDKVLLVSKKSPADGTFLMQSHSPSQKPIPQEGVCSFQNERSRANAKCT